jgi:polyphosphate kinase 2 (PPK2 family)
VEIDDDGEPVLLRRDGSVVDTWRQGYPYDHRMTRHEYDRTKRLLQIELLKLQRWVKDRRERLLLVFEGRDTAGNGGTIQRFTEHLNPAARTSSRWRSRTSARRRSGTSSPTSSTTGPASSGS